MFVSRKEFNSLADKFNELALIVAELEREIEIKKLEEQSKEKKVYMA